MLAPLFLLVYGCIVLHTHGFTSFDIRFSAIP